MIITWHGLHTIKMATPTTTVVIDPHPKTGKYPAFRGKATVVALTHPSEPGMSYTDGIQEEPTIINSPGEYSIGQVTLHAFGWHDESGKEHSFQRWSIESMVIVHLGALERTLTAPELQALEQTNIDILFLPIGTTEESLKTALSLLTTLEPRIVIPINYESASAFAKHMGVSEKDKQPKLVISSRKLPSEGMETIILFA